MKTRTIFLAAVMLFGLSAAAFAQATFEVGSSPVTTIIKTGYTELVGSITFSQTSGLSVAGTIQVTYQVVTAISNDATTGIAVVGNGDYAGLVSINSVTGNVVVINVPANKSTGGFTLSGVRIQAYGNSLPSGINAQLTTLGNAILAGQTLATVVTAVADGIAGTTVNLASVNGLNGTVSTNPTNIVIKEVFLAAYTPGVGMRISLDAKPPVNTTLTFPGQVQTYKTGSTTTVIGSQFVTGDKKGTVAGTSVTVTSKTDTPIYIYYYCATDVGDQAIEDLIIPVTIATSSPFPMAPGTVNASVILAPQDADKGTSKPIPRFGPPDAAPTPAPLVTVLTPSTALLMPFAQVVTGYDTGIAIANTTEDPGTTALGFTGAIAQSVTITFYLFPQGASSTPFTYTTKAGSPGSGLDANGNLISGSTYVVTVGELLGALTTPQTTFTGYIIAIANFTNAHGLFTLFNTNMTFSQGALMSVLASRQAYPEQIVN